MSAQKADVTHYGATPENKQSDASDENQAKNEQVEAVEEEEQEAVEELSLDIVFEILKNERRRAVLQYLNGNEDRAVLGDLAEHIAAIENDTTIDSLTAQQRKRVYVGLYQCHLPKMDDAGVVEFDRNRGIVELGANAEQLEEYLIDESATQYNWPQYYLGLTGVGGLLFFAGKAGLFAGLLADAVMAVLLVAFAACAVAHHRLTVDDEEADDAEAAA